MEISSVKNKALLVEKRPWEYSIDFLFLERVDQHSVAKGKPIEVYTPKPEEAGAQTSPTFSMRLDEVQELMDNLWRIGFRPTEGTGSAGALAATQKHLEDMRKIVFNYLEKE